MRIDRHDNIWTVDEGTNMVAKFDPTGTKVLLVIGVRPPVHARHFHRRRPHRSPTKLHPLRVPATSPSTCRTMSSSPTATATTRVVKYDKYGRFLAKNGQRCRRATA